jgi:hypothetical protein
MQTNGAGLGGRDQLLAASAAAVGQLEAFQVGHSPSTGSSAGADEGSTSPQSHGWVAAHSQGLADVRFFRLAMVE